MKKINLLVLMLAVIVSGCTKVNDMILGKDNTLKPTPLAPFTTDFTAQRVWAANTGASNTKSYLKIAPVIVANTIYTVDPRGTISAIDRLSGKILWQTTTGVTIVSGPSVLEPYLAVTTNNAKVLLFNSSNGKMLWSKNISNEVLAPPTLSRKNVYVKTVDGNLYAFDTSGKKIWKYEHTSPDLILRTGSSPLLSNNLVIAGFSDGKLVALDASSGSVLWERDVALPRGASDVERMVDIDANPVIVDGIIYVATYHGDVVAMSLQSGQVLWQHKMSTYSGIAVTRTQVIVPDGRSYVWAFDRQTGKVNWQQKQLKGRGLTAPATYADYVVLGDAQGVVHWLDAHNGHFVTRIPVGKSAIYATPVIADNTVYVLNAAGTLSAYTVRK